MMDDAPAITAAQTVAKDKVRAAVNRRHFGQSFVRAAFVASAAVVVLATIAMIAFIGRTGVQGAAEVGLGAIFTNKVWKPEQEIFGALPLLLGTATSALGAIFVGAVPAVLGAAFVHELAPPRVRAAYRRVMEVAAAVPSVVYGWLALRHLVPVVGLAATGLYGKTADVGGECLVTAALLLGVMIGPTVTLLALDSLSRVPAAYRDASSALGASPLQTMFRVVLPGAWRGLTVAIFFGFARAAGETMAVQMVVGGARNIPKNLFAPATTISAQVVMDMANARPGTTESNILFTMALLLLVFSVTIVLGTRGLARGAAS